MGNSKLHKPKSRLLKLLSAIGAVMGVALVTGFVLWPKTPAQLVNENARSRTELLKSWEAGDVAVLIRHAERCDRSDHQCLGPADGITLIGSETSTHVGEALSHLGLAKADIMTSPVTRTEQTAHYMFNKDPLAQAWLASCGSTLRNDVVAHKVAHRNLVLVTHSGCIADFEKQTGYKHAAKDAEYTSSLFVRIAPDGRLQVLGIVNAEDWNTLSLNKQ